MKEEVKKTEVNAENKETSKQAPTTAGVPIKTVALIVLLALIAGLLVYVAVNPKGNFPFSRHQELPNPAETTLNIEKATQVTPNKYSTDITVDTHSNSITAVQIELSYDPKLLSDVVITPADFFPNNVVLINKVDQENGRITFAVAAAQNEDTVKGSGKLATITFSSAPYQIATTVIRFMPKTSVTGVETTASLLKSTADGLIEIGLTPTPTTVNFPTSSRSAQ